MNKIIEHLDKYNNAHAQMGENPQINNYIIQESSAIASAFSYLCEILKVDVDDAEFEDNSLFALNKLVGIFAQGFFEGSQHAYKESRKAALENAMKQLNSNKW